MLCKMFYLQCVISLKMGNKYFLYCNFFSTALRKPNLFKVC
jgi:hypothetical protein